MVWSEEYAEAMSVLARRLIDVRLQVVLAYVLDHCRSLRDGRCGGRVVVSERRGEEHLLDRLERVVGLLGQDLVHSGNKVQLERIGVHDVAVSVVECGREHANGVSGDCDAVVWDEEGGRHGGGDSDGG